MMVALLYSNGQLRTERDGDTDRGCQKPTVQQKTTDCSVDAYLLRNPRFVMLFFSFPSGSAGRPNNLRPQVNVFMTC